MAKVPWAPSQSKLVDSLVEVVVRHAPEGWEWAHVEVNMVAELWSGTVSVTAGDKELSGGIKEGQALALLRELRHRMYVAGAGAWYSMTLDIDPDRTATATYNYDDDPEFDPAHHLRLVRNPNYRPSTDSPQDRYELPRWCRHPHRDGPGSHPARRGDGLDRRSGVRSVHARGRVEPSVPAPAGAVVRRPPAACTTCS